MCGKCQEWGQLFLRLSIGPSFIAHGAQKLFERGPAQVAESLTRLGIPLPELSAWLLSLTEFFGGIFLLLGIFTRWASIPVAFAMLVAILTAHSPWKHGLTGKGGYEFALTLMMMALCLMLQGGGKLSVDNWLKKIKKSPAVS